MAMGAGAGLLDRCGDGQAVAAAASARPRWLGAADPAAAAAAAVMNAPPQAPATIRAPSRAASDGAAAVAAFARANTPSEPALSRSRDTRRAARTISGAPSA